MKTLKSQLKTIARSLAALAKQVEKVSTQVEKLQAPKKTTAKKTVAKKKQPVKKAVAKKKTIAKKAVAKKKKPAKKQVTVLDSVLNVIKRSKKGSTIANLQQKTGLDARQLSNALYKLSKKGQIKAKARGIYVKK